MTVAFPFEVGRKGHVVLLSAPDEDVGVSKSVDQLGSFLCSQGFSASVDRWSRREQCSQGPLVWLYSQLQKMDSTGGRVVLTLTQNTSERAEEWIHLNTAEDAENPHQLTGPYADLFTASLFIIHRLKMQARAAERFVLVNFDTSHKHNTDMKLPELLRGLPMFHLPSQTQSLLTELTVAETEMGRRRRTWIK